MTVQSCHPAGMDWDRVAGRQNGVITVEQALGSGLTRSAIRARVSTAAWQRLQRGVYLTHSGPVSDQAAALTRSLPRARSVNGFPTTSLPRTIIDIADRPWAAVDDIIALTARVCQRGLTTPARIGRELASRRAHRLRRPLQLILGDVDEGIESLAEHRFLQGVVRAHGLPPFAMQAVRGRSRADFHNKEFSLSVEIDGLAFHAGGFRSDRRRDRKASARGVLTVRATWWDVEDEPCDLAGDLADALRQRGWRGRPVPCSVRCALPAGGLLARGEAWGRDSAQD